MSVSSTFPPTAKQLVGLGHDNASRSAVGPAPEAGAGTIDQLVPFQCSINTPEFVDPTAKQSATPEHEMANSAPSGGPAGLALGTTDQRGAAPDGAAEATTTPATSTTAAISRAKPFPLRMVTMAAP